MLPNAASGESIVSVTLVTDPYYYRYSANNNFSFQCDYNAPYGQINLVFPDSPCAAFDIINGYSGEINNVVELQVDDLYSIYAGSTFDLIDILTFKLLAINPAQTGEVGVLSSLSTSTIFNLIGSDGTYSEFSLILPDRAEFSSINSTGEYFEPILNTTTTLSHDYYSGENVSCSITPLKYADYILTEGPSAYWKFDEQSGSLAADFTGNNTSATISGAILANSSPVASRYSFYFDGSNDTVIGNPTGITSSNLTQELWVKPAVGSTITLYTPSASGTQGTSGQRYAITPRYTNPGSGGGISVGSNGIQVSAYGGGGYLPVLLSYQQPISTSQYTHVLVSWNNRTPTLYVNGLAVATGFQAREPFTSQGLPTGENYGYYKGYMQDVAIYSTTLTASQARNHYLIGAYGFMPILETFTSYSGSFIDLTIADDMFLNHFSGEILSSTFNIYPAANLTLVSYDGSINNVDLTISNVLSSISYTGEINSVGLEIFESQTLLLNHYSDELLSISLTTSYTFPLLGYSGEYHNLVLTNYPGGLLDIFNYIGEVFNINLVISVTFPLLGYSGSRGDFDLDYIVNPGSPGTAYSGSRGDFELATTSAISFISYTGEDGISTINPSFALSILGYSGSVNSATLTTNLPDLLTGLGYSGEYANLVNLSFATTLSIIGYAGQLSSLTFSTNPPSSLLLDYYSGTNASITLLAGIQIPAKTSYSGEWANVISMDTDSLWFMYAGGRGDVTLSTSDALPNLVCYEGNQISLELTVAMSEGLGLFVIRPGEWLSLGLEALYSVDFRVLYRTSIMTQVDIRSATYFDLTTDECCNERPQSNNLLFIIERGMYPEEVGYGNRTYMTFDLQCRPRFSVEFQSGAYSTWVEIQEFFEFTFPSVHNDFTIDWMADLRHRLCKGYFIPSGNWIVTELTDVLLENCYVDRFYGGETFACSLIDDNVLQVDTLYVGTVASVTIVTADPWSLWALSGERFFMDQGLEPIFRGGELFRVAFYEPPIIIETGGYASLEIVIEMGVRFLEEGCLDNEFVWQDEEGDMIPEMFNSAAVEGEPYKHDVRAKCF